MKKSDYEAMQENKKWFEKILNDSEKKGTFN
jgi:hypothetical protein